MAELFTAATLSALAGRPVSDETAAVIHSWVAAAIAAEIGALPDEVPPGVAAVALELGKAAVPTPGGATSTTIGPYSASYAATGTSGAPLSRDQRLRLRRAVGQKTAFSVDTATTSPSGHR
ncbi:hypothetical protein SAMN05421810_10181 [Amycolatopsis arida]|uniref:Uncharacterized protein n=1 Tax=Amycolatopsis arida TaxID=587909 RepID=A0A1I5KD16_9PSEU|nr:hypothetical protein [Amycolatopsis arida]TDX96977.1 hypothetical protein CLV69_10279 [Amycolatopsis arida]SFO82501.1 hypothetical protein SAMN05421810_10181 [Amycolatopsis arida]